MVESCPPFQLDFVTSNRGKFEHLMVCLEPLLSAGKLHVRHVDDVELQEVQADSIEAISKAKAMEAHGKLGRAVVVQDSGLVIEALQDFPGPYTKYVLSTIGVQGLLKLMEGKHGQERRCGFANCLCYCDTDGSTYCFSEPELYWGKLAEQVSSAPACNQEGSKWQNAKLDGQRSGADDNLFTVFIPCDEAAPRRVTLSELSTQELHDYRSARRSAFRQFADWLAQRLG